MPLQIDPSVEDFYNAPGYYLLSLEQNECGEKILKAEKKGCWTWIQANWLNPSAYKLHTITEELQNNPAQLTTRCADLLLAKITRYNINHKDAPIAKTFLRDFIKENDVSRKISQKLPTSELSNIEDYIHSLLLEHLRALTPETALLPRAPLTTILMAKLQEKHPTHTLPKDAIRAIAIDKYCYIAACNFNLGRTIPIDPDEDAIAVHSARLEHAIENKFDTTGYSERLQQAIKDKEELAEYFERLQKAIKNDFKELTRLTNNHIEKHGKRALRNIHAEHFANRRQLSPI